VQAAIRPSSSIAETRPLEDRASIPFFRRPCGRFPFLLAARTRFLSTPVVISVSSFFFAGFSGNESFAFPFFLKRWRRIVFFFSYEDQGRVDLPPLSSCPACRGMDPTWIFFFGTRQCVCEVSFLLREGSAESRGLFFFFSGFGKTCGLNIGACASSFSVGAFPVAPGPNTGGSFFHDRGRSSGPLFLSSLGRCCFVFTRLLVCLFFLFDAEACLRFF